MKTLHLSITFAITAVLFFSMICLVSHDIFATSSGYTTSFEDQFGNITKTKLVHDGAILILNQTTQKLTYTTEENIIINTELINIGNKTVTIGYCEPLTAFEIKNQAGYEVWPRGQIACVPELTGKKTLQPGEHLSVPPYGRTVHDVASSPIIATPGNYTVLSVATFSFHVNSTSMFDSIEYVWSKPLQITIAKYVENETNSSMAKTPEFSIAIPVLLIGITSVIVFYRVKFVK